MINVSIIGTVFIDCKGFSRQQYHSFGRNLGSIEFVHGGVGRNVAENLARLQLPVSFVSTVDKTGIGDEVVTRLRQVEVDTQYCLSADNGMGMWLAIMSETGDLAGSISQMPDLVALENLILRQGHEIIELSSHVVLELDLNDEITRSIIQLSKHNKKPVYGIPGNLDVILRNREILRDLDCFICNHIEVERLSGDSYETLTQEEQQGALQRFVDQTGMKSMVVTLGGNGSIFYDRMASVAGHQPVFPVELIDSSGAGDAFFSGTVMGLIHGRSLAEAVVYGTKVAGWTIQSKENVCASLGDIWFRDDWFKATGDERSGADCHALLAMTIIK